MAKTEKEMNSEVTEVVETAPISAPVADPEPAPVAERRMVKIRIPRTRKDQEDVFVSVNNDTFLIKRGYEVEVPDFVAEVLKHQEEMLETIMQFEDQNTQN